jgi:hypothetical protein
MKRLLPVIAVVIVAAVAVVAVVLAKDKTRVADPPPPVVPIQQTTGPATVTPGATVTPEATTRPGDNQARAFGNLVSTFRQTSGSDAVSCGAVDTEFAVSMASGDGKVRWTGQARDILPQRMPFPGSQLSGISLEPQTGLLEIGQRQVIRVRGTFDGRPGQQFWVVVSAPNATGSGWTSVPFTCR